MLQDRNTTMNIVPTNNVEDSASRRFIASSPCAKFLDRIYQLSMFHEKPIKKEELFKHKGASYLK